MFNVLFLYTQFLILISQFPICVEPPDQTNPSVCACSSKYIASWVENTSVCGQIISFDGVLEKNDFLISEGTLYTTLSSGDNNNRFLAVNESWNKGYFISPAMAGVVGSTEEWGFYVSSPVSKTACWDGERYFVVVYSAYGEDKDKLFGFFVSPYGEVTDTFTISVYVNNPMEMSVAFNGINYLVVWKDKRTGNYDIYGQRVSKDKEPVVGAEIHIITSPVDEITPQIASDGSNWLVVGNSSYGIYSCIVKSDGQLGVIDTFQGTSASVTFGNNVYVVAGSMGNVLILRKISTTGVFIDSTLISTENQIYNTAICSKEDNRFVAFSVFNSEKQNYDLYGAIVRIGIEENNLQKQVALRVAPNPFYSSTKLIGNGDFEIYDMLGRKQQCKIADDRVSFGYELRSGIYFLVSPFQPPVKIIKLR